MFCHHNSRNNIREFCLLVNYTITIENVGKHKKWNKTFAYLPFVTYYMKQNFNLSMQLFPYLVLLFVTHIIHAHFVQTGHEGYSNYTKTASLPNKVPRYHTGEGDSRATKSIHRIKAIGHRIQPTKSATRLDGSGSAIYEDIQ